MPSNTTSSGSIQAPHDSIRKARREAIANNLPFFLDADTYKRLSRNDGFTKRQVNNALDELVAEHRAVIENRDRFIYVKKPE